MIQEKYEKSKNTILFEDKDFAQKYGVSKGPSITINGQIYRGEISGYNVYKAICASFQDKYKYVQCGKYPGFDLPDELGDAKT